MRRVAFVLALFLLVPVLSACGEKGAVHSWRQKLVLDVETPTGPKSGGSVVAVDVAWYSGWEMAMSNGTGVASYSKGEASFVEIAPGKYLFALSVYEPMQRTLHAFVDAPEELRKEDGPKTITARLQSLRETRLVAPEDYPVLVTFDDIARPETVRRIDPDDLDATFGLCPDGSGLKDAEAPWRAMKLRWRDWARRQVSGMSLEAYNEKDRGNGWAPGWIEGFDRKVTPRDKSKDCRSLKSITIEITDEKVTGGEVEKVLRWMRLTNDEWQKLARDGLEPMQLELEGGRFRSLPRDYYVKGR